MVRPFSQIQAVAALTTLLTLRLPIAHWIVYNVTGIEGMIIADLTNDPEFAVQRYAEVMTHTEFITSSRSRIYAVKGYFDGIPILVTTKLSRKDMRYAKTNQNKDHTERYNQAG